MPAPRRPLPALHRLAPRLFYGWFVALGGSLVSFTVVGIGFYGLVVFLGELCESRGWDRASVSGATSFYWITSGLTSTLIGRAVDRHGARRFIAAGAVLMAGALLLLARVDAPWQLYPVYALLGVGFAFAGNVPSSAIIARWFVASRARAMSISQTGVSVGGMLLVPAATALIEREGFATALAALAALLVLVVLPTVAGVLRWDPVEHGLAPDGRALEDAWSAMPARLSAETQQRIWSRGEVLRTRAYWLLAGSYAAMLFCQVAFTMHQLAFLRERLDPTDAALGVSLTAAGSMVARLAVGVFADRVRKERLAAALFILQAACIAAFSLATETWALYAACLVLGATIGNIFMLQALLVGELFGMASFATVMGMQILVTQLVSGLGPLALGVLYQLHGGYAGALGWLVGIALVAAAMLLQVRPPAPADPTTTAS